MSRQISVPMRRQRQGVLERRPARRQVERIGEGEGRLVAPRRRPLAEDETSTTTMRQDAAAAETRRLARRQQQGGSEPPCSFASSPPSSLDCAGVDMSRSGRLEARHDLGPGLGLVSVAAAPNSSGVSILRRRDT